MISVTPFRIREVVEMSFDKSSAAFCAFFLLLFSILSFSYIMKMLGYLPTWYAFCLAWHILAL
jgi:hypothetical protein